MLYLTGHKHHKYAIQRLFVFLTEKPHNPMINAGAILVCTLLKTLVTPEMNLAEKFDFTMNYFKVCV